MARGDRTAQGGGVKRRMNLKVNALKGGGNVFQFQPGGRVTVSVQRGPDTLFGFPIHYVSTEANALVCKDVNFCLPGEE